MPRMLFRPDAAGDAGAAGAPPADPPSTQPADPPATPPADPPADERLTQAQVDDILKRRLAAERKKWQTEAEEAARQASMSETERLKAEKEAAEKTAADAIARANATLVQGEARLQLQSAGVPREAIADVLRLLDFADVEVGEDGSFDSKPVAAAVDSLKKRLPGLFGVPQTAPGSGAADFSSGSQGKRVYSSAEVMKIAQREPLKFAEIEEDWLAANREGRVVK